MSEAKSTPRLELPGAGIGAQFAWKTAAFFLLTVATFSLCGLLLQPFLPAITGAAVLGTLTRRPYHWWRGKIRKSTVAAASALALVTFSIIGPILFVGQYLLRRAIAGVQLLQNGHSSQILASVLERFPQIGRMIESSSEFITIGEALQKTAGFIASNLGGLLSNSLAAISQIIVMLFLLFFLYRDEAEFRDFLGGLLPLTAAESAFLMKRLGDTLRATVVGRLIVASIQGVVAALIFSALGVRAAVVLGLLTTAVGLIPPFGPYLVWLPVAIWLGVTGHWIKMIILLAAGTLIISTLDNFLYPALVGAHLRQHTVAVFLSLIGGIWMFGLAGLVLGPLIFSASEALLLIWRLRLGAESREKR